MTNVQDSKSYERNYNTVNKNIQKRNRRTQRTFLKAKTRRHLSICCQTNVTSGQISSNTGVGIPHDIIISNYADFCVKYKYILCHSRLGLNFKWMSVPLIVKLHISPILLIDHLGEKCTVVRYLTMLLSKTIFVKKSRRFYSQNPMP